MKQPLLSIIIPVWNAKETIADCLNSITQQKFQSFETIIVDGISTDNTIEIIKSYGAFHNDIRWISEKDHGIYDAMNKGIGMSTANWVYFLGSDDALINSDSLQLVAEQLTDDCDIFYGDTVWVPENFYDKGIKEISQLLNEGINHQRVFYRKSLFEKYGVYNIAYIMAADFALNIRFFCAQEVRKKYRSIPVAYYHSAGLSATTIDVTFWNNWKSIIYKNFAPHLPKKMIYKKLSWYCWYMIEQKNYAKAFNLFCAIYFHTFSFSFLKHTISQLLKIYRHKS